MPTITDIINNYILTIQVPTRIVKKTHALLIRLCNCCGNQYHLLLY